MKLPAQPVVYEINTWVWLHDLNLAHGATDAPITLGNVPDSVWDALAALPIDAVWLMGVWQRSPAGRALAFENSGLVQEWQHTLPDFTPDDVIGSPYCIRGYVVDDALGGRAGLEQARRALAARGIALLLDFVPNHVAPDHPWTDSHPEYFIHGTLEDHARAPAEFIVVGDYIFACGRDPYSPPWTDVVQLNTFAPGLRTLMANTLLDIAAQCDGVRCDMAMLAINGIFGSIWGGRAGAVPESEYWTEIISAVKSLHPDFVWMAEAYWDTEAALHQLGFDYCYDKRLYDHLVAEDVDALRALLGADPHYQSQLVRFTENHDEPRAASHFPGGKAQMAAIATATQAGMRLFHEGQLQGRKTKVSVFLQRRPAEAVDEVLARFYARLLPLRHSEPLRSGAWRLCVVEPAGHGAQHTRLVAWCWQSAEEPHRLALIVINPTRQRAQGRVHAPIALTEHVQLQEVLSDQPATNDYQLTAQGIHLELMPYGYRLLLNSV